MAFDQLVSPRLIDQSRKPKFLAIADALALAMRTAQLIPGEKLPPQRDLARFLGVTTGTVSRAYARLETLGLATARIGDGTYVRMQDRDPVYSTHEETRSHIDLAFNIAIPIGDDRALADAMAAIAADPRAMQTILHYQAEMGAERHRIAGAAWLKRFGFGGDWSRVMVTNGGQHALSCILRAIAPSGATILSEGLGYPGLRNAALALRMQLIGIDMDSDGISTDALERAAKTYDARLLFLTPTLHNPTGHTMSPARREMIAEIALKHRLIVIENGVPAALAEQAPPAISTLLPAQSLFFSSFSKIAAPGLRIGFLETKPEFLSKIAATMRADAWMVAPILPEIATRWIESGEVDTLAAGQRAAADARLETFRTLSDGLDCTIHPGRGLIWLPLPEGWQANRFAAAMREDGVLVRSAAHFTIGRTPVPCAIRLSLAAAPDTTAIRRGLEILRERIAAPPG